MSAEISAIEIAREFAQACSVFFALLLAVSALHKWLRPARGVLALRELVGASPAVASAALMGAAAMEAAAALLACVPALQMLGMVLAAGVYLVYSTLLAWAVARGRRDLDCGCTLGIDRRPLGALQIAKAGGLCALACACAGVFRGFGAALPSVGALLAGLAGLALYFAVEQLAGLTPLRAGELS